MDDPGTAAAEVHLAAQPKLVVPWVESPFFEGELAARRDRLSPQERALATDYHANGYAVAAGLVMPELCDRIRKETGPALERTGRLPDAWRQGATSTRHLATLPEVQRLLHLLYERRPIPFQTLNFRTGTEQMPHSDSVHFTSFPARFMCGVWVALEDIGEDSGPLFYYPGSQVLPEVTMYDLALPAEGEWFDRYGAYERFQQRLMEEHGWKPVPFLAKKGDALIWSSNVVHGGSPIGRPGSTRWSQVTHYLFEDCIYYQPHSSIVPLGELKLLDITDLNTLEPVPHRFDGQSVVVEPLPSGRSRVRLGTAPAPAGAESVPTAGTPPAEWRAILDLTRRTLDRSVWGRQALRLARAALTTFGAAEEGRRAVVRTGRRTTISSISSMPPDPPIWFPPQAIGDADLDARLAAGGTLADTTCPACGWRGPLGGFTENVRESGHCPNCGAWTRIRQMAAVMLTVWQRVGERSASCVAELAAGSDLRIYNTEAHGVLHGLLSGLPGYVASEYFGPEYRSGELGPGGVRHEDLQQLSFPASSFDVVLSTDVLEHVADPYRAHEEIWRVLRPGGHHIFTVPYQEGSILDDVRATVGADGALRHLAEPLYHEDPVRPDEGALVFTIFGLEMLVKLAKLGLETTVYRLWDPPRGIVGGPAVVFDAVKRARPALAGPADT